MTYPLTLSDDRTGELAIVAESGMVLFLDEDADGAPKDWVKLSSAQVAIDKLRSMGYTRVLAN